MLVDPGGSTVTKTEETHVERVFWSKQTGQMKGHQRR